MSDIDRNYIEACYKKIDECKKAISMYEGIMEGRSWDDNKGCREKIREQEARIREAEGEIRWCMNNPS